MSVRGDVQLDRQLDLTPNTRTNKRTALAVEGDNQIGWSVSDTVQSEFASGVRFVHLAFAAFVKLLSHLLQQLLKSVGGIVRCSDRECQMDKVGFGEAARDSRAISLAAFPLTDDGHVEQALQW